MTGVVASVHPAGSLVAAAMSARLVKIVDHDVIRHNLDVLRSAAGGRKLMPVVKGDAYGLGAAAVARTLVAAGVEALAVDTVAEGLALRAAGVASPVLVMDLDVPENAAACVAEGLTPTVAAAEHARRYAELARDRDQPVTVWLRTNIGFNRFGPRDGFAALLDELAEYTGRLRFAGLFAHLTSSAWEEAETGAQAAEFADRLAAARARLGPDLVGSLAATHGLVHAAALRGTAWIRPGIGLYGTVATSARHLSGWPDSGLDRLRPAWQVRARVLDVVTVTRPEGLGYDRTAPVFPGQRIASVAIGFSRGLTASANGFSGLLHGRRCSLVGRPGMDCTQIDVSDVPRARAGDWLTVLGTCDGATVTASELADELGCSPYELMATFHMPVSHTGLPPIPHTEGNGQ
ncbi:MAG TPA: alanine racemase [Pseudonocardiaceae bacterium]|nr:alanine racemase [Pseudonocardiaceae bacterium]